MTDSIAPQPPSLPPLRVQPSMLSVPSAANTVAPASRSAEPRERPLLARRKLWFFTALSLFAGVAGASLLSDTERASAEVRSGSPGFRQAKNGQLQHWQSRSVTIYLDDSLQRIGPRAGDAVVEAFGRWAESDPRLPDVAFDTGKTRAVPVRDGLSTISYGRIDSPGHERDLAITVTYASRRSGEIVEADIVLNALYPISVLTPGDCDERYDLQNLLTHEAGHFFGLGEDPVERGAAMFQTIDQCETHKRALSETDVGAMSTLYADMAAPEEVATGPLACGLAVPAGNGSAAWLARLLVGLLAYRRRRAAGRC